MKLKTNKPLVILLFLFQPIIAIHAQQYSLDQVRQVPAIDEANMKCIASSVWYLYSGAMKNPPAFSNLQAINDTVFTFKNNELNERHEKSAWVQGMLYTTCYKSELDLSDRLLFNLNFDSSGTLLVPDKIIVISNREELPGAKINNRGSWAFQIPLTDSIKDLWAKVKLEHQVLSALVINAGTPVGVRIPFKLTHHENAQGMDTRLAIKRKHFHFFSEEKGQVYENDTNIINAMHDLLEYHLMMYKKANFKFVLVRHTEGLQIDLNIKRHQVWASQQTKSFPVYTYEITNLEGKGVRSRYYRKVRKQVALKMHHPVRHWPALDK